MVVTFILLVMPIIAILFWFDTRKRQCLIVATIFLALLTGWAGININAVMVQKANSEQYKTLTLYQSVVADSNNEEVRFDFYSRVEDWNQRLNKNIRYQNNFFLQLFVPNYFEEDMREIDFALKNTTAETLPDTP